MITRPFAGAGVLLALKVVPVSMMSQTRSRVLSQWDGVFTDAQAERGRVAYDEHCASSHGADLRQLPAPSAPSIPQRPIALVGRDFFYNWGDLSLLDLTERIRITMPPTKQGTLPRSIVADMVAFILKSGGSPAGASELPSTRAELGAIRILERAPRP
jgi:cytochrome c